MAREIGLLNWGWSLVTTTDQYVLITDVCYIDYMQQYKFTPDDLEDLGQVGVGNYGTVLKMSFKETGTEMAVKVRCISFCPKSIQTSTSLSP